MSDNQKPRITSKAWVALAILMGFYLLSYLDKQVLALLANLIGPSLKLSDTQLGMLQGFIFSLPYAVGVLVVGYCVDRYSRRGILFAGVIVWSIAATMSGLATSFESLALFRAGVGLGEAVLIPAAMSIIASVFPRDRVAFAIGLFYMAANIGGIVATLLGGVVIQTFVDNEGATLPFFGNLEPWQAVLVVTGIPGLMIAFLAFVIRIDIGGRDRVKPAGAQTRHNGQSLRDYLVRHRGFLIFYTLGTSFGTICAYTLISWAPAYFGRSYGWDHSTVALVFAASMVFGALGNIGWGMMADYITRRGQRDALFRIYIPLMIVTPFLTILAFAFKVPAVSIPAFMLSALVYTGLGPAMAALQIAAPDKFRGRLTSLKLVVTSVIGLGLGPVIAGVVSDHVFRDRTMIGEAMVVAIFFASFLAAIFLAAARKGFLRALGEQLDGAAAKD